MAGPTREFWQHRFVANETSWDRGAANPQLATWLASGALAPCRIFVPGGEHMITGSAPWPSATTRLRPALVAAGA
ncbi:MAG TPA: hypothetical protein VGR42_02185 [Casimicrobiaceae bacterium]|nr:hypothetical protein [Casimicrobiaceae bacterium]